MQIFHRKGSVRPLRIEHAAPGLTLGGRRIAELPLSVRAALEARLRAHGDPVAVAAWLNGFLRDNPALRGGTTALSIHATDVAAWWRAENTLRRPRATVPAVLVAAAGFRARPARIRKAKARGNDLVARRLKILADAEQIGLHAAARRAGISAVTLWRWRNLYRARGAAGLATNYGHCGRHGAAESLSAGELGLLRRAYRRTRSLHAAVAALARAKVCTSTTKLRIQAWIARGTFPGSLIRVVQHDDTTN